LTSRTLHVRGWFLYQGTASAVPQSPGQSRL